MFSNFSHYLLALSLSSANAAELTALPDVNLFGGTQPPKVAITPFCQYRSHDNAVQSCNQNQIIFQRKMDKLKSLIQQAPPFKQLSIDDCRAASRYDDTVDQKQLYNCSKDVLKALKYTQDPKLAVRKSILISNLLGPTAINYCERKHPDRQDLTLKCAYQQKDALLQRYNYETRLPPSAISKCQRLWQVPSMLNACYLNEATPSK